MKNDSLIDLNQNKDLSKYLLENGFLFKLDSVMENVNEIYEQVNRKNLGINDYQKTIYLDILNKARHIIGNNIPIDIGIREFQRDINYYIGRVNETIDLVSQIPIAKNA